MRQLFIYLNLLTFIGLKKCVLDEDFGTGLTIVTAGPCSRHTMLNAVVRGWYILGGVGLCLLEKSSLKSHPARPNSPRFSRSSKNAMTP